MKIVSILPADTYIIVNKNLLNDTDRNVLYNLYQPIIGSTSISLYFTLWSSLDRSELISKDYTHHYLMNSMNIKLDEIVSARKRLESLGLLKTYYKEGNINSYIYELYSPLIPSEFFSNPLLSSLLFSIVGKKSYQELVNYYKIPKMDTSNYENITVHFSDIYNISKNIEDVTEKYIVSKDKLEILIDDVVDFNFITSSMPSGLLNDKALNEQTKKLINKLSYLYNFDNITISNIIKNSINEKGMISESELKKNCKNYYSFENNTTPKLVYKSRNNINPEVKNIKNIKEKLIECFECTSPYDFLKSKYGGAKPTMKDVNLLESLLADQELNPGVINVLIDYVLRTNDKKLNRNLVEAIASQWKMCNITTVKDAMMQAEKEYRRINQIKEKKNTKKEEKLPTWYGKDIKKKEMTSDEVKELENMLSEFV